MLTCFRMFLNNLSLRATPVFTDDDDDDDEDDAEEEMMELLEEGEDP